MTNYFWVDCQPLPSTLFSFPGSLLNQLFWNEQNECNLTKRSKNNALINNVTFLTLSLVNLRCIFFSQIKSFIRLFFSAKIKHQSLNFVIFHTLQWKKCLHLSEFKTFRVIKFISFFQRVFSTATDISKQTTLRGEGGSIRRYIVQSRIPVSYLELRSLLFADQINRN